MLEIVVAIQVHNVLKHRSAIRALLKAVSQVHRLGMRKATNHTLLSYGTPTGSSMQGQTQTDPRLEQLQLLRELLAIGFVYINSVSSTISLSEAGWLREDVASSNPMVVQLLKSAASGGEIDSEVVKAYAGKLA